MKKTLNSAMRAMFSGMLIIIPLYLAILLLLKGMKSITGLIRPIAAMLPDWVPAETLLALLFILLVCFLVGVAIRTAPGKKVREQIERGFFERVPGYALLRSLTQQIAGEGSGNVWRPCVYEGDEGLIPAFIIEEFEDGRYTIFCPSIPTPLAGAVYVVDRKKVHPLDVPFTVALKTISRWGSGAKDLVEAMEKAEGTAKKPLDTGGRTGS